MPPAALPCDICVFHTFFPHFVPDLMMLFHLQRNRPRCAGQAVAKSKYEENVFPSNHVSVWGSYYDKRSMRWGFSCCHSLTYKSYCTGEDGKVSRQSFETIPFRVVLTAVLPPCVLGCGALWLSSPKFVSSRWILRTVSLGDLVRAT